MNSIYGISPLITETTSACFQFALTASQKSLPDEAVLVARPVAQHVCRARSERAGQRNQRNRESADRSKQAGNVLGCAGNSVDVVKQSPRAAEQPEQHVQKVYADHRAPARFQHCAEELKAVLAAYPRCGNRPCRICRKSNCSSDFRKMPLRCIPLIQRLYFHLILTV